MNKIFSIILLIVTTLLIVWACTKIDIRSRKTEENRTTKTEPTNDTSGGSGSGGGGDGTGGGDDENPIGTDNFTYLYSYGSNYVRYTPIANKFEKVNHYNRDIVRQMMPIDLHSWSIANANRSKLIFSHFKVKNAQGTVLYEYHDTEGAVHVSLAQNEREDNRGNNHQINYSRFLIASGTYTIEYECLSNSIGKPSLEGYEQHEDNHFRMLVGSNLTGNLQGSIEPSDRILVTVGETITRSFTINFIDENNCIFKFNANGFEH